MAGINAGPSQGFWSRIGQNLPGALNMAGSMMPGPFGQTAKITGALMKKPPAKEGGSMGGDKNPGVPSNGPSGMPPSGPSPVTSGIVRGPSMPRIMPNNPMGGIRFDPTQRNGNTGITGGMFPGGFNFGMQPQPAPVDTGMGGTGLWNMYNNLSNQMPQRQLFY